MAGYVYRGNRPEPVPETVPSDQRIIDAAIELYGERGFDGVSLRTIADRARVSAPLISHHFGNKAGLRSACDKHATQVVNEFKNEAVASGHDTTTEMMLVKGGPTQPILRYIIQSLILGGPEIDELMDGLVNHAVTYTREAAEKGLVKPAEHERRRAALLLLQGLGSIMLHRQMKRLIGVSLVEDPPEEFGPYVETLMDIYTEGIFEPGAFDAARFEA